MSGLTITALGTSTAGLLPAWGVPEYTVADFSDTTWWLVLIKAIFIVLFLILSVIMALWVERRALGRMQTRHGPNVAGPLGLLQAIADAGKMLFKEEIWTKRSDKFLYFLAPVIMAFAAFSVLAVIPFGPNVNMFGHSTPLMVTDMPVATLYILAITSLGVYGVVLGGWSARSTLPLYGAVRSSAQMVSYELSMGMALVSVFLMAGTMSTSEIVASQGSVWWAFALAPAFVIYLISMVGEVNRLPFDLPEAEGELVAGHMTEYSSMKFGWYYLAEYINMLNVSAVAAPMFLGGWHAPWPFSHIAPLNDGWWGMFWLIFKIWVLMFAMIWTRGTLLRLRYDQFMNLGWKGLIPVALVWIVLVAVMRGVQTWVSGSWLVLFTVMLAVVILVAVVVYLVATPSDQGEEEGVDPDAPFDAFLGGYPPPPVLGQKLPPSPRAGRAKVAVTAVAETDETIPAIEEDSND